MIYPDYKNNIVTTYIIMFNKSITYHKLKVVNYLNIFPSHIFAVFKEVEQTLRYKY